MDDRPVDLKKLTEPFPREALMTRPVQGKNLAYVQGHTVINRLNAATGNHWDFEVVAIESREITNQKANRVDLLMTARVRLTLPGLGSREHVGVQMVSPGSGEDLVKGAITDALKKAATLFGVGIELYGPDYEDAEPVDRATGEITAKTTVRPPTPGGNAERVEAGVIAEERARVAKALADLSKRRGVNLVVLGRYAAEKVGKPLETCDAAELGKLITALQNETDIPGLIDYFANPPGEHAPLLTSDAADRTPANFR